MSKRQGVKSSKSCRGKEEELLPPIGGTAEEIHRTLVAAMRDFAAGRISVKQANRITHSASVQLYLLSLMERLGRDKRKVAGDRFRVPVEGRGKNGHGGGKKWVN